MLAREGPILKIGYLFFLEATIFFEFSSRFPGKGLTPLAKWPFFVEDFVICIENSLMKDMDCVLNKHYSFLFLRLIVKVWL